LNRKKDIESKENTENKDMVVVAAAVEKEEEKEIDNL